MVGFPLQWLPMVFCSEGFDFDGNSVRVCVGTVGKESNGLVLKNAMVWRSCVC